MKGKNIMKNMGPYLLIALLWSGCFATSGHAGGRVTWAWFRYPPMFIMENEKDPTGFGFDIMDLAISAMPEFKHDIKKMPIKRFVEQMKAGKDCICAYGMIKTPDREKWAFFSQPCRIIIPRMIVVRKDDLTKFGGGSAVSIAKLIKNKKLTLLLKKGTRYGERIDTILNENPEAENITYLYTDELGRQALKMLMNRRGDYCLSLSSTLYEAEKLGYADKIALIPIEDETYLTGRVACSKTEKGKEVVEKVNRMLHKEITSGKIYQILSSQVPDMMRREFKRQYEILLVEPLEQ